MKRLSRSALLFTCAALATPVQLAAQPAARPVSLGVRIAGNAEGTEARIVELLPDRTGAAIGFKVGDVLVEAGGKPISPEVLTAYMQQLKEGDPVSFRVRRADAIVELTGKGMAAPDGAPRPTATPR